jgi:hypothetical protein
MTAHYIDAEFKMHQRLMAFEQIHGDHSGENLARIVYDCLSKNNLREKLHCVTVDNARNNDTMVECLSEILQTDAQIVWDHETHHVRCLAHIINIVVGDFLKGMVPMSRDTMSRDFPIIRPNGFTSCDTR